MVRSKPCLQRVLASVPVRARAAQPRRSGHRTISCRAPGCRSVYYQPRHEPGGEIGSKPSALADLEAQLREGDRGWEMPRRGRE